MREISSGAQGFKYLPVFVSSAIITLICLFFSVSGASAQGGAATSGSSHESARAAQVRALNNSVLQLHGQMQENASGAAGVHSQAAIVLAQRAAALQTLIQENPHAALTFAFSPELLADLAAKFPDSATQLESHTTLSGPIEHWIFDSADLKSSRSLYKMKAGQQELNLYFAGREPDLAKGGVFQVTGVVAGGSMAVSETSSISSSAAAASDSPISAALLASASFLREIQWPVYALIVLIGLASFGRAAGGRKYLRLTQQFAACAAAFVVIVFNPDSTFAQGSTCSTTGVQNTAVILVTFPNVTLPSGLTIQSLNDMFFNSSTGVSLDGFLRDASYGQTSATGSVFGPYTLTGTYASCADISGAVLNDSIAAAVVGGANLNNYNRVFLVFPDTFNCGWAGFAAIGSCSLSTPSGSFNASVAYLAASYLATRSSGVALASHEIGHNMGLLHSGTITSATGTDVLGPVTSPGTEADQGDYWSTLGEMVLGLYPAPQKAEVLKWMSSNTNYQVVQNNGTYTLQPLETSPAGLQVLKVQRGTGNNEWLWIEYRQATGAYDSTLLGPEAFAGALIHYEDANTALGHTYLPNFTPTDTTGNSPALAVGKTWNDPYSNLSISVLSATSSGLTVSVSYGTVPCTASTPSVSVSPLNPSTYPGQAVSYSVSVTNNDSPGCSPNTINMASSEPSGWSTSLSSTSLTLSPGQSASVTLGKGVPPGTATGTYSVNLNASNATSTGTGTANATVLTPLSLAVSVSVGGTSFTRPGTVPVIAHVTSGGTATAGASVTFTVATPNGSSATQSATTGANGTATWSYKLNQRSLAGTYTVSAQAGLNSGSKKAAGTQTVSSTAVTFAVQ